MKPFWPDIEYKLKEWISYERKMNKKIISIYNVKEKTIEIANDLEMLNFNGSLGWTKKFMDRNGLASRQITSIGKEDSRSILEIRNIFLHYLDTLILRISTLIDKYTIYSMDETPIYIDIIHTRTISFKGEKHTEVYSIGHQKLSIDEFYNENAEKIN